jgi:hypothetical protein
MVPGEGVEPSLPRGNWILNPARLPIPPSGQVVDYQQVDKHCNALLYCKNRDDVSVLYRLQQKIREYGNENKGLYRCSTLYHNRSGTKGYWLDEEIVGFEPEEG